MKFSRYWDSNCFLGWFNKEPDKYPKLEPIVALAEAGKIVIVTSTITLVEVFKIKGKPPIQKSDENTIQEFFDQPFISLRDVTPMIGKKARDLLFKYSWLHPYDATHAATALHLSIPNLDAFDFDILKLNDMPEFASIEVSIPNIPVQMELEQNLNGEKT